MLSKFIKSNLKKKKIIKKNVCLHYLKFSETLPETHLFLYLASRRYKLINTVVLVLDDV